MGCPHGLARPDFFDWSLTAKGLAEMVNPDVVLVMFANDAQRIKGRSGDTIHWRDERLALLEAMARLFVPQGRDRRVIVLGPTNRRSERHVAALQRVREIQRRCSATGVLWLDLFPHSTDEVATCEGFDVFGKRVHSDERWATFDAPWRR